MNFRALEGPRLQDGTCQTQLEFPDNRLLIDLFGEFSRNLVQVEEALSVQVVHQGNRLTVFGEREDVGRAVHVLEGLHRRLEAGREITASDIDAEIRMGGGAGRHPSSGRAESSPGGDIEIKTRKKLVEPRNRAQRDYASFLFSRELVFGIGPAGTGKTYLAVAAGVNMFVSGHVDRIILSRPAVEAGERLGFLPGDMKDKVDPYMQPLYDALNDFLPEKQLARLIDDKRIEIAPLAFMRGRTLSNAFVVLDEAQNATAMQMKMFLTRLGEGSRMAVTGDMTQMDLPRGIASGLRDAERRLAGIDRVAFCHFTSRDVVRHPLVARIIDAYGAGSERQSNSGRHAES